MNSNFDKKYKFIKEIGNNKKTQVILVQKKVKKAKVDSMDKTLKQSKEKPQGIFGGNFLKFELF